MHRREDYTRVSCRHSKFTLLKLYIYIHARLIHNWDGIVIITTRSTILTTIRVSSLPSLHSHHHEGWHHYSLYLPTESSYNNYHHHKNHTLSSPPPPQFPHHTLVVIIRFTHHFYLNSVTIIHHFHRHGSNQHQSPFSP